MGAGCCKEEAIDFNGEIELSHFHLLRSVGKGAFGKVRVVQHKRTKEIYALKYINKAKCIRMRAIENIIQERRLLEEVEFPLICNLRYAFQDDENLFMVLDLMLGGDLRFHLERAGPMKEDVVRFYVAELALALNALHSRRVIHRDLKPDNILLDEHGHAHLTDFNIAVYFNPNKPLLSIAGSMAYMAPEVLLRKGYFESVDWWSLGVITFELLFGKRPFRGKSNDLLTNSILRDPLPFPENVHDLVSTNCIDVVSKLCERNISKRLGCTPDGLNAFKKHPWFDGLDWDKLVSKQAVPPFQPDSKRANFDATHELEELLMEDNPLKAKKRAQTSPETELSAEMQMMEDKFTIYDFTKVKRSTSLNRGRILRPTNDPKMNSGTLDGVVTRTTTARTESSPTASSPKIHRPDSPSDRIGQDRFHADDEHISLTQSSYRRAPLGSPTLKTSSNNSPNGTDSNRHRTESEKAGYLELQDQPSHSSPQLKSQGQGDIMQSEAIILPPSSLPRPLQPRDNATGLRVGSPRHQANTSISASSNTTPSSPSNSFAQSPQSSYAAPTTTQNSPPIPQIQGQQYQSQQSGAALFSSPDSGMPLSSLSNGAAADPLQDPANLTPVSRRIVRGRESAGYTVNSMPASISGSTNPRLASSNIEGSNYASNPRRPLDSGAGAGTGALQYQRPWQSQYNDQISRPASAYTSSAHSSSTLNDGSVLPPGASYQRQPSASSIRSDDRNLYRQQQHSGYGGERN
ncbi:hypothetical protein BGX27_007644 [Mortierella sp. AM989]|nr:hypothetical protein BGX27_007644 [Mortierella sp. AM989]